MASLATETNSNNVNLQRNQQSAAVEATTECEKKMCRKFTLQQCDFVLYFCCCCPLQTNAFVHLKKWFFSASFLCFL